MRLIQCEELEQQYQQQETQQDEKLETDDSFFDGSQKSMQSFIEQMNEEIDSLDDISDVANDEYIEATCGNKVEERPLLRSTEETSETSSTCPNSKEDKRKDAAAILAKIADLIPKANSIRSKDEVELQDMLGNHIKRFEASKRMQEEQSEVAV